MAPCTTIMKTTSFDPQKGTSLFKTRCPQQVVVSLYLWLLQWSLKNVTPRVTSLISKPQAQCVPDQLSGSPAVPNLPWEPLTPPVASRMDMVFVVLVEGKALILMTLRSPGLRAHDGSHRLCWLNCKYSSVHKHRRVIIMGAGLGFCVKYWCMRDSFGAEWHCFDVRVKRMVLLWC